MSRYPAVSHTFFLQEVLGLRALGMEVVTASINVPDRAVDRLSEAERGEAAGTFYVKGGAGKKAGIEAVGRVLRVAVGRPAVVARGLAAVAGVRGLTLRGRVLWLAYLAEALLVGEWMRRERLPHLHVHFGGPVAAVGMLTARAWGVPFSLTIHGPEELQNMASHHLREKVGAARFAVCISDFCRSQLQQISQVEVWGKFAVVRLGVDAVLLERSAVQVEADGLEGRPVRVVCVGRLVPEKGQRLLLEAVRRLRLGGLDVRLTLAGDGVDRAMLEREAADLGGAVGFSGAVAHTEALELCAAAEVFVLPSFAEGIPVALMEAMALGVACVSTTVAGIPELVRDGVNGVLVAPANVDALTAAMERLVRDAGMRRRLGAAARETVRREYCLQTNVRALAEVFLRRVGEGAEIAGLEVAGAKMAGLEVAGLGGTGTGDGSGQGLAGRSA